MLNMLLVLGRADRTLPEAAQRACSEKRSISIKRSVAAAYSLLCLICIRLWGRKNGLVGFARVFLIAVLVGVASSIAHAGDVADVCNQAGVKAVELEYRNRDANLKRIKGAKLGKAEQAVWLTGIYKNGKPDSADFAQANSRFIPQSEFHDVAIKFSTKKSREADLEAYRTAIIDSYRKLLPEDSKKLDSYLRLKDPLINSVAFTPVVLTDLDDLYGATVFTSPFENNKFDIGIAFSIEESESLPYLITLIAHELVHALGYKERIELRSDVKRLTDFKIIDEAKAFDHQIKLYLELAKKDPKLFCNWTYRSWAYGGIPIPLAWTMASMEKELKSGRYMFTYATQGIYAEHTHLLNAKKTDLRADLKAKIKALKLRYVR